MNQLGQIQPDIISDDQDQPKGWRSFASHLFAPIKITWGQFFDLLVPLRHSPHIRRHAASVIISRIQLVAAIFAVMVPLWSIIDWFVFPWPEWAMMTTLRLGSGIIFFLLSWPWQMTKTRLQADAMLMAMLLVPPVFYILSIEITAALHVTGTALLVTKLYALMPNIVLAGLAIFPLTAFEVLVFSAPAFFFAVLGLVMGGETLSLDQHGPMIWLMVLVMGVAMFSGMSQLHYITALVNRAMIDPLTGAYTRRSGGEALDLQFRLAAMRNTALSVAFFDLDKFKSINDTFGHEEGDKALRNLADKLREGLRRGDVLVRWGGEEFVAILTDTNTEGAKITIERLRAAGFGVRPDGAPLTASIGVAERGDDNAHDWPQLIELADQRMYEAKRSGRDRAILPGDISLVFGDKPIF
ncbi:GGDEF domain-containing protein [Paramagnetospirillum kuznetsovii]|uniref:diguanylate cyclase n=1 Tax=Paramagnetospirillum kuznetsovii TaxID=2053833 RepID=A0A364NZP9_9PROT|nr:sensor domain-containing diguanylate cyclase [Paramagnetospirillum kuznetsovii]RAU22561.1 GGDEF domain-containing protein [Paramagnetospirillum kuznetsovii]